MVNLEGYNVVLTYSENSKTSIGAPIESPRSLVINGFPKQVEGSKPIAVYEISHFCVDNLISNLRRQIVITL